MTSSEAEGWGAVGRECGLEVLGGREAEFARRTAHRAKWVLWLANRGPWRLTCCLKATRRYRLCADRAHWYLDPGEELGVPLYSRPFAGSVRRRDHFRLLVRAVPDSPGPGLAWPHRAYHLWKPRSPYAAALHSPLHSLRIPVRYGPTPTPSPTSSECSHSSATNDSTHSNSQ